MEPIDLFKKYTPLTISYAKKDFKFLESIGYERKDIMCWALEALWKACLKKKNELDEPQFMRYLSLRVHGEIFDNVRKDKILFGSKNGQVKMRCFSQININQKAQENSSNEDSLDELNSIPSNVESGIHAVVLNEELFIHITSGMSKKEKYIVKRRFFDGLTMREISKELNISPESANWIYATKIRSKLRTRLSALV